MRILLIKMSSMGDVFHTFPALTDAMQNQPGLVVDWVVEEAFQEIPKWHPVVDQVYSIRLRQWRKHPIRFRQEIKAFFERVNQTHYDLVIDAQGLLKSAWVVSKIKEPIAGMDWGSAREKLASLFYQHKYPVAKHQHAISRLRELFARVLDYPLPAKETLDYHLATQAWQKLPQLADDYMVFLHGTTWDTKLWPEAYWIELLNRVVAQGKQVVLPWGNEEEKQRAKRIAKTVESDHTPSGIKAWVPNQKLDLNTMACCLKFAKAVVSVDTGLSHVAAALDVPMVVIYRVTDPDLVGALGNKVRYVVSPLAKHYLKSFAPGDEDESKRGIQVTDVCRALEGIASGKS
ncbi:lipopolysaccharide heptosyltransferase I [Hydrogenovibrio sp. SC-1]|uniref:lipopolysaccharide heptosyltransferase I n=1 Tax=Hydrogenovibrio sp. SC-1 TaxID=2065820 RepID=UPI000C7D356C|nr:lipopolysaccharide heptosyltransferase I [Hydrogenovibrio sp. SC-1]PLA75194.1 lipopolysaccharide heptosyltransferase I [Hydrogenovibrio sp. SC-1]